MVSKIFPYYRRWVKINSIDLTMLKTLGGEEGCQRLAQEFYARVATNAELKPLFPGKSVRCATEEFAAFLIQFLGGDEEQTQYRWWLSLSESHARFQISEKQRIAWLRLMTETIDSLPIDSATQQALRQFFRTTSSYVIGKGDGEIEHQELNLHWRQQTALDELVDHLGCERDAEAIELSRQFSNRPSVLVGILARMMKTGRPALVEFGMESIRNNNDLALARFNGRTLLHHAASSSCLPIVQYLMRVKVDPNILDAGGHSPLYRAASSSTGTEIIKELVKAGATVDLCGGVNQSTALHQAARFGNLSVTKALLDLGANPKARDKKGLTPLDRAINCRKPEVAALLSAY